MTPEKKTDLQELTSSEKEAAIASRFINCTNCPVFLTGKAGTGKTTFLRIIAQKSHKNTIIAAPTGIAAINAGGVTLHSLFQLPFGSFIPENNPGSEGQGSVQISTPRTLLRDLQLSSAKRILLRELELLIIDEVSMLRADLLDAIDVVLRSVRRRRGLPFGGVQMLFIGDLLQLPPVVKEEEWNYLARYYPTAFFFEARVFNQIKLKYIELEKIYRQSDPVFIDILNHFRNNGVTREDNKILNRYYKPQFKAEENQGYINLTTHNRLADDVNREALKRLPLPASSYQASVRGDFNENLYPVEFLLNLKVGAQVMFIKNDYSGQQRYFNGKIGKVSGLEDNEIFVGFDDGTPEVSVDRYTWENKRYRLDKETNEITDELLGTFTHFPIKLAWAITVHKSQGLTFKKAIIDVSRAFAPGQIYVALSRLESLEGLVLTTPIPYSGPEQDQSVKNFEKNKKPLPELETDLENESLVFISEMVEKAFDFNALLREITFHIESYNKEINLSEKQKYRPWMEGIRQNLIPVKEIAGKFLIQAKNIIHSSPDGNLEKLLDRVVSAKNYFEPIITGFSKEIFGQIENLRKEKRIKKYLTELADVELLFFSQIKQISKTEALIRSAIEQTELTRSELLRSAIFANRAVVLSENQTIKPSKQKGKEKKEKVDTRAVTLQMVNEGKSVAEIAKERGLVISTIEGHIVSFIGTGVLKANRFISEETIQTIYKKVKELDTISTSEIRAALGDKYTWGELRIVMAGYLYNQKEKK